MKRSLFCIALGTVVFAGTAPALSFAGTWNATVTTPNGRGTRTLVFAVKGDSVTGRFKRPAGDVPLAGTIKGKDLTYRYSINVNGQSIPVTVKAKVMGDSLAGTMDFGGQMTGDLKAKRAAKPK
jgi:hypothetical protein